MEFGLSISSLEIQYRTNTMQEWKPYTSEIQIILTNINDYVQFKNNDARLSWNEQQFVRFYMTGTIKATGNIQSMANYSDVASQYGYYTLFYECSSLTTAPELPATTLQSHCYESMFFNCANLTTAPELPAGKLAEMCYCGMFNGCSNLNYIKVGFTNWLEEYYHSTTFWLANVARTGTFVCPPQLQIKNGDSYIPEGWTVQTGSSQEQPPAEDNDPVGEAIGIKISNTDPLNQLDIYSQIDGNYYLEDETATGGSRYFKNMKGDNIFSWIQFLGSNGQGTWFINNSYGNSKIFAEGTGNETIEEMCKLNWISDSFANFTITPCYQNNNSDDPVETPDDPVETPVEPDGITISGTGSWYYDGNYYSSSNGIFYHENDGTIRIYYHDGQWSLVNSDRVVMAFAQGDGNETIVEICNLHWAGYGTSNFTISPWFQ